MRSASATVVADSLDAAMMGRRVRGPPSRIADRFITTIWYKAVVSGYGLPIHAVFF